MVYKGFCIYKQSAVLHLGFVGAILLKETAQLLIKPFHIFFTVPGSAGPMAPDGWKYLQLPNTGSHVRDFILGILRTGHVCDLDQQGTRNLSECAFNTHGKYRSVCAGRTSVFALMLDSDSSKWPLYGSCSEQSPLCHVCSMTSMFSGSAHVQPGSGKPVPRWAN